MLIRSLAVVSNLLAFAATQCPTPGTWGALGGQAAPAGEVCAVVAWDPDGAGPLAEHYVFGGAFEYAGTALCRNIALYDLASRSWSAIDGGFDGPVHSLLVTSNNELIAGGAFTTSGATQLQNVARLVGGSWQALPAGPALAGGTDGPVHALAELPTGDLVVGGEFSLAGQVAADDIARFDGAAWHALGAGMSGTPSGPTPTSVPVYELAVRGNDLIAAGYFTQAGGSQANGVARWDGTAWSSLGYVGNVVRSMIVRGNGDLLVNPFAGDVQSWDGIGWSVWANTPGSLGALVELGSGVVRGSGFDLFAPSGVLYEWGGAGWSQVASGLGFVEAMVEFAPNELILAGARFGGVASAVVLTSSGSVLPLADGLDVPAVAVAVDGLRTYVGGWFTQIGGVAARGVAIYENGSWSQVGSQGPQLVNDMLLTASGELVAVTAGSVELWDGTSWNVLPAPLMSPSVVEEAPNGDLLIAGGNPMIVQRGDGSAWSQLGVFPDPNLFATDLAVLPNGNVVVAGSGSFHELVWQWDGSSWSPLPNAPSGPAGFESVRALHVDDHGDLWCGGQFALSGSPFLVRLARFDGSLWTTLASPAVVVDIDALPNGALLLTQNNGTGSSVVATDGSITPGVPLAFGESVYASAVAGNGRIATVGTFGGANGLSGGVAHYEGACPANATNLGGGCDGSAGPIETTIERHAWLGETFESRTSNVPANSIAVQSFALNYASTNLASVLPQAGPLCALLIPDVLWLALPSNGEVVTQWTLPSAPALLFQRFYHQVVVAELDGNGAITSASLGDGWDLTIGAW